MLVDDAVQENFENNFEERAERLSKDELTQWTAQTDLDRTILEKLKGNGVKLLLGPRGSGKSTLFRVAYFELQATDKCLPAYINYSQSLALEPLFHNTTNATKIFRQWVLHKVRSAVGEALEERGLVSQDLNTSESKDLIRELERGNVPEQIYKEIAPSELIEEIEAVLNKNNMNRSVLLMDDAAHAFSEEQQREFFEIFRQLKSRRISSKAAVYPGITSYSHGFNVGHEAEILEIWYQPTDENYLPFMRDIAHRRLSVEMKAKFSDNYHDHIDLLALAAFGQPRAFLNMLSDCLDTEKTVSRKNVLDAIEECASYIDGVFGALADKLPRYSKFIEEGRSVKSSALSAIATYNSLRAGQSKTTTIGIQEPLPNSLYKILQFFEYSGFLRKTKNHSRGRLSYERYMIHNAAIISSNSLAFGRNFSIKDLIGSLQGNDSHMYVRTVTEKLVDRNFSQLRLNLPPCSDCSHERLENQKFCGNCGAKLKDSSVYIELLQKPISVLPLSQSKLKGIYSKTNIMTIQDLLLDENQTLLKVPRIGKVWARRIRNLAEEFIGV
jgi:ABC-type arginine transport system ATPase subunit